MIAGGIYLVVVLMGLFIAPLVLGSYVVVGGSGARHMTTYFGVITVLYVIVLVAGILAMAAIPY